MTEPRMTHDEAIDLAAAYVLGALERTEEAAVRDHLATCAEPHLEFEALGGVVPALDALDDLELVDPPASLGDRIMAAAAADLAANPRAATQAAQPAAAPSPMPQASPIPFPTAAERAARAERTRTSRFDWALRIAAVLAIVAVGAWGQNLQSQLDTARRFEAGVASVVRAASQAGAKTVVLAASKDAKASGIAAVSPDGSVTLAMKELAPTSGTQVYETWVIVGKDAPIAVGGFAVGSDGTAVFTTHPATTPPGAIIAVTLEPNAGNTAPQGPVVSSGIAAAPPAQNG